MQLPSHRGICVSFAGDMLIDKPRRDLTTINYGRLRVEPGGRGSVNESSIINTKSENYIDEYVVI